MDTTSICAVVRIKWEQMSLSFIYSCRQVILTYKPNMKEKRKPWPRWADFLPPWVLLGIVWHALLTGHSHHQSVWRGHDLFLTVQVHLDKGQSHSSVSLAMFIRATMSWTTRVLGGEEACCEMQGSGKLPEDRGPDKQGGHVREHRRSFTVNDPCSPSHRLEKVAEHWIPGEWGFFL